VPDNLFTALDRAAARRFPRLFEPSDPLAGLRVAVGFLVLAGVLALLGEPYCYGAGPLIGGAIGLILGVMRQARRSDGLSG
jgi:hypothetical protein